MVLRAKGSPAAGTTLMSRSATASSKTWPSAKVGISPWRPWPSVKVTPVISEAEVTVRMPSKSIADPAAIWSVIRVM